MSFLARKLIPPPLLLLVHGGIKPIGKQESRGGGEAAGAAHPLGAIERQGPWKGVGASWWGSLLPSPMAMGLLIPHWRPGGIWQP